MQRRAGNEPIGSSNGGGAVKGKEAGQKASTPFYLQPSPATITVDASAFELLSRGANEEEARLLRRFLTDWSRGDENTFPFQFALLTRAQMRAAASVPLETAKVLQQHQNTADDAARRIAQAADAKLAQFEQVGKLAADLNLYVQTLRAEGEAGLAALKATIAALRDAEERAKQAARNNDWLILGVAFLVIAVLAFLLGVFIR